MQRKSIRFYWKGLDKTGCKCSGYLSADNKKCLEQQLLAENITPLSITRKEISISLFNKQKISKKHIADFTRALTTLIQSGIPLVKALEINANGCEISSLQQLMQTLQQHIEGGMSFSQALAHFPHYFDSVYCGLIDAGEQSGTLAVLLAQLADYQERMLALKAKIAKALYYPAAVFVVAIVITCSLLIFVVPQFQTVFANFGAQLPVFTQWVIQLSHGIRQYGIGILIVMGCIIAILRFVYRRSPHCQYRLQAVLLKIPVVKTFINHAMMASWARILATTTQAGVPLVNALQSSGRALKNPLYRRVIQTMTQQVIAGESLYQSMESTLIFPARATQMIAVGENAGMLSTMLQKIADIYQAELNNSVDNLSKLLEPVIMMVLAVLAGGLIIAMYLPVFKIGAAI